MSGTMALCADIMPSDRLDLVDPLVLRGMKYEQRGCCVLVNKHIYVSIAGIMQARDPRRHVFDYVYSCGYGSNITD